MRAARLVARPGIVPAPRGVSPGEGEREGGVGNCRLSHAAYRLDARYDFLTAVTLNQSFLPLTIVLIGDRSTSLHISENSSTS